MNKIESLLATSTVLDDFKRRLEELRDAEGTDALVESSKRTYEAAMNAVDSNALKSASMAYGTHLALSRKRNNNQTAVHVLEELQESFPEVTGDCMLFRAVAKFHLGEYRDARLLCEGLLRREPERVAPSRLHALIQKRVKEDGISGLTVVVGVTLAAALAGTLLRWRR